MKKAAWLCVFAMMAAAAGAEEAAPAGVAMTDEQVAGLIVQLGDRDPQLRDEAERKLLAVGKPALPLLEQAAKLDDPEISNRAQALSRRLLVPAIPGGPLRIIRGIRTTAHSLQTDGGSSIEFYEDGRHIQVEQGIGGIALTVSETLNGKTTRQTYRAADDQQLRRENPDVYTIYQRAVELAGAQQIRNPGPFIVVDRGRIGLPQPLEALENLVEDRMERQNVSAEQRREVRRLMERTKELSPTSGVLAAELENEDRLGEFFSRSDALRDKLVELGLPDGAEALPPQRRARLGVQLHPFQLTVSSVAPDERGAKMGLKQGDLIQKLNGKQVSSVMELREALAEAKGPIVIEGRRGEEALVLKEPQAVAK